jgi:iron complex outermembrane receptor protein
MPKTDRSRPVRQRAAASSYLSSINYVSAYAQDELGFFNNALRLSLGLRYTNAQTTAQTAAADKSDDVISPRVGLSYSIDRNTSVYALYDQSFVPVAGLDSNLKAFVPIRGNDYEVGIKRDWFNGRLSTSATAYQIKRQNALNSLGIKDSRGADVREQLGETTTKGIEVDVTGQIATGLNAVVNYAYTDSKISKEAVNANPSAAKTVGNITPNTGKHITNAWITYRMVKGLLKGFGVSGGMQWQADRTVGTATKRNIPNYFRTDGGVNYQAGRYNISFLVNNLGDDRKLLTQATLASGAAGSYYTYIVEARRNFRLSLGYRF